MVQAEYFNTIQVNFSISRVKQKEKKVLLKIKQLVYSIKNGINYFIVSTETQRDVITIKKMLQLIYCVHILLTCCS
jgi:hypothetical protein